MYSFYSAVSILIMWKEEGNNFWWRKKERRK